jgi:hypothetical protein
MTFNDDGPDRLEVSCVHSDAGSSAGQWMVSVDIYPHEDLVDKDDPNQFDAENGEIIPESAWMMPPKRALRLAALITRGPPTRPRCFKTRLDAQRRTNARLPSAQPR